MRVWRWLRRVLLSLARVLGRINTLLLLAISFFLLLLPLSLVRRVLVRNSLPSGWLPRDPLAKDHYHKQY